MCEYIKIVITNKKKTMKQLLRKFKQISVLILAIAFIGCEDEDTVLPQVVAGFTYTINQDTRTVTFINISENAQKYEWNLGDGTTSTLINPVKRYEIGTYNIVLQAKNVAGASDTFEDTIIFLDQDVPLITLIGDSTINVTLGETFTDPGATALDEVDGDLTSSIVVGGDTVDTNVEGVYTITYDVSDAQGNEAIQVERTVNVSAISCVDETEESLSATDLNITFLSDPEVAGGGTTIFEDNVTYEYANNPDPSTDANTSCKVGKITKSGVQAWDNLQINFADKFTFTDGSNITLKVYSPVAGYNVTLKLEDQEDADINTGDVLSTTQTTKTNEWEELTIPFNAVDSGKYDKMVIFFDLQGDANTNTYYVDDIKLNLGTGGGGDCVAESMQSINPADFNLTFMSDPGTTPTQGSESNKFFQDNVTYEYVDNPDFSTAANNSCKVGKVTKSNVQAWDNLQIDFDDKFTFTNGSNFTIKVFSPVSGYKVTLKLEDKTNGGIITEVESTTSTTKTNEWEELTIPFGAADSDKYDRLVVFFDLATANSNTYYFDDLKLNLGTGGGGGGGSSNPYSLDLPINFENDGHGAAWTWNVFENEDNPPLEFIANPVSGGINTSATVAKVIARQAGAPWVGTETAHGEMGITWDLSASNAIIKIMVYKTVISDVGIKLVNPAGGAQGEIKVANTKINEWEELTFDFSSRIGNGLDGSTNIDQIVVFPDFRDPRTEETVTYFDNITFN